MLREAGNALQQERAPEGPCSPWQQQLTLQIPGKGDVTLCGTWAGQSWPQPTAQGWGMSLG